MGKTIPGMKETADKIVKDIDIKAIARKQRDKLNKLKEKQYGKEYTERMNRATQRYLNNEIDLEEYALYYNGNKAKAINGANKALEKEGYGYSQRQNKISELEEYNLYKRAKENPESIDPMTENSMDWEALEEKYASKYKSEKDTLNYVTVEERMREAGVQFASNNNLQAKANKVIDNIVKQKLAKQQAKKKKK